MKNIIILFFVICFAITGYAQAEENATSTIEEMTSNTSTDPLELRAEAEQLNIPESQVQRYVTEMRNLNQQYQNGSVTRTEYVEFKRQLIEG